MNRTGLNYMLLNLAVIASTLGAAFPQATSGLEPVWSILQVGLVIAVALLLQGDVGLTRHGTRQKRILLIMIVAGVFSSFQWLLLFQRHQMTAMFQLADGLLYLVVVGLLAAGQLDIVRRHGQARGWWR